ncbi:uncharacterized protein LOC122672197 [Telopea speciosissima]|uniref:uncharacterized protein LOC122672197 n=1 Tax=Telopea speciosissima TaxID=54955 RepID=UPI001CC7A175|nr:uncharacterized protein LOC122672197 [Telopea speciosissima]
MVNTRSTRGGHRGRLPRIISKVELPNETQAQNFEASAILPRAPKAAQATAAAPQLSITAVEKTQVVPYLIGQHLYDYVTGDKPCPDDLEKAAEWRVQDAAIMSLLITSLVKDALPLAVGRVSSKEIWDALTFLHRVKELSDELAAAGKPLPTEDFNIHIFRSLQEEYQSVVPTIMYRQPPLTYSELHGLLMSHESLITSRRATVDPSAAASVNLT